MKLAKQVMVVAVESPIHKVLARKTSKSGRCDLCIPLTLFMTQGSGFMERVE